MATQKRLNFAGERLAFIMKWDRVLTDGAISLELELSDRGAILTLGVDVYEGVLKVCGSLGHKCDPEDGDYKDYFFYDYEIVDGLVRSINGDEAGKPFKDLEELVKVNMDILYFKVLVGVIRVEGLYPK